MSISVTQEEAKFRPVTIVIDDFRTASLLNFVIGNFLMGDQDKARLIASVDNIENTTDATFAIHEISTLKNILSNYL